MPKNKKLTVCLKRQHAMQVTRVLIGDKKLVYVILAQKKLRYRWGRSRIAYIGTTKTGGARIATSVARRAENILNRYGVREFHVRIVTCAARRNVKTWRELEHALLLGFREIYGDVPKCNIQRSKGKEKGEFRYFNRLRIKKILTELE